MKPIDITLAVAILLIACLFLAGCEPPTPELRANKQVGEYLESVFVIDAPTGKCVEISGGKYTGYKVAPPSKCGKR